MKHTIMILIAIAMLLIPAVASAQMTDEVEVKQITNQYDLGLGKRPSIPLFDLSRIHFNQSYSLSFFSGGGTSGSAGLYNGTIQYRLADPLLLTFNLGILHDPGSLVGSNSRFSNSATFLPSGWLDWRPSDNFHLQLGFETHTLYNDGYYSSGRYWPWYR